jgi:CRISPR/Cas system-associated protein endoribonuclease Cas2
MEVQFELRKISAKLGFIKQTEVGIWQMRRMRALTGILQLGEKANGATSQLLALKDSADPWLRAAASYALNQMASEGEIENPLR